MIINFNSILWKEKESCFFFPTRPWHLLEKKRHSNKEFGLVFTHTIKIWDHLNEIDQVIWSQILSVLFLNPKYNSRVNKFFFVFFLNRCQRIKTVLNTGQQREVNSKTSDIHLLLFLAAALLLTLYVFLEEENHYHHIYIYIYIYIYIWGSFNKEEDFFEKRNSFFQNFSLHKRQLRIPWKWFELVPNDKKSKESICC